MDDFETAECANPAPGLPMVIGPHAPRPSLGRNPTSATFVSQLLAARDNLPSQRLRRRGSVQGALGAYHIGAGIGLKRMPLGYRTTILA